MTAHRIYSFSPVTDKNIQFLILGTIPGKESLIAQQYYANKRNAFRKILTQICHAPQTASYEEFLSHLLSHNIGLWDVVHSCEREGSLDSKIKNPEFNDIEGLIKTHTQIHTILFNGLGACKFYSKHHKDSQLLAPLQKTALPSTSPAHARMTFQEKLDAWAKVLCKPNG